MMSNLGKASTDFRVMIESDLAGIMLIENEAYPYPWDVGIFHDCLRSHYSCWVGVCNDEIISYAVMSIAAGESHILNLCVRADMQGRGYGAKILTYALDVIRRNDVDMIFLEVRRSNKPAQRLYKAFGFDQIAERKAYYPKGKGLREDAFIYALSVL